MKTKITLLGFFVALNMLASCSSQESAESETASYYCPMKCEAEKTYDEKGSCPVCKMDLVVVE